MIGVLIFLLLQGNRSSSYVCGSVHVFKSRGVEMKQAGIGFIYVSRFYMYEKKTDENCDTSLVFGA